VPIAEDLQSTDDCVSNQEMKKDIPAYNNLLSIPSIGDRAARPDPMVMDGLRIAGAPNLGQGRDMMKRSRNKIISEILEICMEGASKTRIVYQGNLNFRTVNPYLQLLMKNDLIRIKPGPKVLYETTEKGKVLLENFNRVQKEFNEL